MLLRREIGISGSIDYDVALCPSLHIDVECPIIVDKPIVYMILHLFLQLITISEKEDFLLLYSQHFSNPIFANRKVTLT